MPRAMFCEVLLLAAACERGGSPSVGSASVAPEAEAPSASTESASGGRIESGPPSLPVRLEPTEDCTQPDAEPRCEGGYCLVQPGCFIQGAPRDEPGRGRYSNVQVQVRLTRAFWMGQTEVAREQWLEAGWGLPRRNISVGEGECLEPECPVGNVSFFDAVQYANWQSERQGLSPCYERSGCTGEVGLDLQCADVQWTSESGYGCEGYRLPMESEWEYATRAGTITAFYGGEAVSTQLAECVEEPSLEPIGWYCHNSGGQAHPVAQKQPNGWGLYDVHGNLFEWCNDLRDGDGYGQGSLVDPPGTLTPGRDLLPPPSPTGAQATRIARGGGFTAPGEACTSADRGSGASRLGSNAVGFRLVRTASP